MKNKQRLLTLIFLIFFVHSQSSGNSIPRLEPRNLQPAQSSNYMEFLKGGISLYQQKKFDEAIAMLQKASTLMPNEYRPFGLMGICYMGQLKYKSASESFAKAIALQPNDIQLYIMKANVDSGRNAPEEGLAACRKALEINPTYAEAHVMMGDILKRDEKRHAEAVNAYQSAIKIKPGLLESYPPLAEIQKLRKDEKGAEVTYRKAMEVDPKKMLGRFDLGRMLVNQGRLVEARELWDRKTSADDFTMPSFIMVLERAENLQRATTALEKNPKNPELLVQMGLTVMEGDSWVMDRRQEKAIDYFNQALKIKPGFAKAQYGICKAYMQLATTFPDKKKIADQELAKLRKLNKALALELEKYQMDVPGGIVGTPITPINLNK